MYSTGVEAVDKMAGYSLEGNVIPHIWYQIFKKPTGKPYLNAIVILSDIVYWYRPTLIRDETSGQIRGYKKKFKSDMLQRNYQQLSDMFGFSKRDATNAVIFLERFGVIKRHFRTIVRDGVPSTNILFIELKPDVLMSLERTIIGLGDTSHSNEGHLQQNSGTPSHSNEGHPPTQISETYTENTTETITKTTTKNNIYTSAEQTESDNDFFEFEETEPVKEQKKSVINEKETEEMFCMLWELYPIGRKQGKSNARKSFARAVRDGVDPELIKQKLLDYKKQIEILGTPTQYIKQGGTWFNGGWEDEYITDPNMIKEDKGGKKSARNEERPYSSDTSEWLDANPELKEHPAFKII